MHWCAWFALVPVLAAIWDAPARTVFRIGLSFGYATALLSLFWIVFLQIPPSVKTLMIAGLLLLFAYFGVYSAAAFVISRTTSWWFLPLAWAGLEYVRGLGEIGFPWLTLGCTQARYPVLLQSASVIGVYGLSAWIVFVNVLLTRTIKQRSLPSLAAALLALVLPALWGAHRLSRPLIEDVPVGIVQPNIDPNLKFSRAIREETFDRLLALSYRCVTTSRSEYGRDPVMTVWPETATPLLLKVKSEHQLRVTAFVDSTGVPILTGTPLYDRAKREIYNGAVLVEPGVPITQEYKKIQLVPFGEHVPYDRYIPLLRKIDLGEGDYAPGRDLVVFRAGETRFACLICFESIFPGLARASVQRGARLLVNITNDGWFGRISGPDQHNDMAILRAVENGIPLVRCANNGISMVVDPYGRVLNRTGLFVEAALVTVIPRPLSRTLYTRLGDVLPLFALGAITLALAMRMARVCRRPKRPPGNAEEVLCPRPGQEIGPGDGA